tara:strand:- start:826 stop:1092 length:267 start_codon:yes stop_codon:yes gene_type:complete
MSVEEKTETQKKDDALVMYVKSLATIEAAMEPFKEQRKGLRVSYIENGRLSKEDINMATKCYRMLKKNEDIEDLVEVFKTVSMKIKGV